MTGAVPSPAEQAVVQQRLCEWFKRYGRDLPWRHTRDPYAVLVSEVMLQQTQVDRVIPRWREWMERFPSLKMLAEASRGDVIRAWSGLGYNSRAVRLHELARVTVDRLEGVLPSSVEGLLGLPGIGRYTAGAVASFAFERPVSLVETNVRRVLGRVFWGQPETGVAETRAVQALADAVLPVIDSWTWNQALMDLGATICTASTPACLICPLREVCRAAPLMSTWPDERRRRLREAREQYAAAAPTREVPRRVLRGRAVAALAKLPSHVAIALDALGPHVRADYGPDHREWLAATLRALAADGLVYVEDGAEGLVARLP
ncbi:MAG: A/G-specific adenine glycosylase [Chloroflexi bacterium]|nr:A/G-specific adenine glycosylase [Chloroflexota bacterium]